MKTATASLGTRLQAAREAADLSRANLASRVGVSRQMIYFLETDAKMPTFELACKLADTLKITLDSLRG